MPGIELASVEFVSDADDVEASTLHAYNEYARSQADRYSAIRSKSKRNERILYSVATLISIAYLIGFASGLLRQPSVFWICLSIVPPVLLGLSFVNMLPKKLNETMKREAQRTARSPGSRCLYGRYKVSVEEEGFRYIGEQFECIYRWPMVIKVVSDEDALYVEFVNFGTFRIPHHAFSGEDARRHFIDAVNHSIAIHGFGISTRILAYAKAHKSRCVGCSYPLADLMSLRCPECGRVPSLEEFPEAAHMIEHPAPTT